MIITTLAFRTAPCREHPVVQINYVAGDREHSRRVYFYEPSGDDSKLLQLRTQLIEAGAYNVNTFSPSYIVCMLPDRISASGMGAGVVAIEEPQMRTTTGIGAAPELSFYRDCYKLAKRLASSDKKPFVETRVDALERQLRSDPVILSPEEMARQEKLPNDSRQSSTATATFRRFYQNAEFMLGNIVVNMILPESISQYHNTEDWSSQRISDAIKGAIAALLTFQENCPEARMNFIIRSYKQAPTYYECIDYPFENRSGWVRSVIAGIHPEWFSYYDPDYVVVHNFNNAALDYYQADWVFSMFIVSAEHALYHMFPDSRQIAFAYLGGPFLVCPFPAGDYYFDSDESRRLAAYLQREIAHIFWALDEGQIGRGDCTNRSGYLSYENGNKIDDVIAGFPVNTCDHIESCLMLSPEWYGGVICNYTAGHMGLVDADENGVPDVFDSSPTIQFETGAAAETLVVDTFTIRGKAISVPIPNQNQKQDTTKWNDYACPLKDAVMNVNGFGNLLLLPEDGRWDSIEEDLVIPLTDLSVGLTSVAIQIRNTAGFKSAPIVKNIFRAGLTYALYNVEANNQGINLSWYMVGETFNARFDLYRICSHDGITDTTMIATNLEPSGEPEDQFLPYAYYDSDVEPTMTYEYFVRGSYELAIQGGEPRLFVTDSKLFKATAIIPIAEGRLMSNLYPNPFNTSTNFSLRVPRSYRESGINSAASPSGNQPRGISREVPTRVKITVYDALGRYVTTIHEDAYYGSVLTLQWDGTNEANEAVPSGIYFIKSIVGNRIDIKKVTVLR